MNIVLVGYGRMGKAIEKEALLRGHNILETFDTSDDLSANKDKVAQADVCIEFSTPQSAYKNCLFCLELGVPVVSGTTGWGDGVRELQERIQQQKKGTFFYASNFSLGMNILFELNRKPAKIMQKAPEYSVSIEETHHTRKIDAPSGTAITLAESIIQVTPDLNGWTLAPQEESHAIPIQSHREGDIPGIHSIKWHSSVDELTLTHEAFGREGFALGAVLAAEYTLDHEGSLTMQQMLGFSDN